MTKLSSLDALLLAAFLAPLPAAAAIDPSLLAGMKARSIGPAAMSGRVAAVEGVPSDPGQLWVGAATGGVWKSTDGGLTFAPVFDDQPVAAIGAVAVSRVNPAIVWVGTGEGNPRNSASVGNGVYRSLDGGRTWKHLGLEATERIHRILLHPTDPDTAWVAALGRAWGENPERGVFKTTDGGRTWGKVLYVDERTGAADLAADPRNPEKLFAAMWEYRRWPWFFRSGGPGSGLHVSHDGGASWRRATEADGLPAGDLGRIGVAVAPSDPRVVYALVEAAESALLRSADGGRTWKKVNTRKDVSPRPFYYADLRVDPENANRVYRLGGALDVSDDGGRTWEALLGWGKVHPDHHALWIHPEDGGFMVNGNDGGIAVTRDRGASWRFVGNLPLAQFYHVRVDQEVPYNVYGGLQDNGSWKGPSAVWENAGMRNQHWQEVAFGDGFDTVPDPRDAMRGYAMSQEGYLVRWDLRTGKRKDIRPAGSPGVPLRFNWNAGIAVDPFAPDTIYFGSQFVHRSTDRGDTWTTISPDLTTDRKEWQRQRESGGLTPDVTGAENFTTIIALAPSPVERGVLWAGTDDGRLHVTRDGGASWTSVEKNVRGVPANTWIPHVLPSTHDAGTAFVVFDDHRRSNWTPYLYRTTDYGRTWTSLATKDLRGYALAIAQDAVDPDLLFLGTEFGLWTSLDGGRSWLPWRHGVPTVSVMDLAVHPRDHDLVIATHGRALYVLDDLAPLRTLSAETLRAPLHLFPASPAVQHQVRQSGSSRFPGHGEFEAENEPYGAVLTYSLNVAGLPHPDVEVERGRTEEEREKELARRRREERAPEAGEEVPAAAVKGPPAAAEEAARAAPEGKPGEGPQVTIEVRDAEGGLVRSFKGPAKLGVNRAVWDLATEAPKSPSTQPSWWGSGGPEALPGTYQVTVKLKDHESSGQVEVLPDPRVPFAAETRRANWEAQRRAGRLQEAVDAAVERVRRTRADLDTLVARAKPREKEEESTEAKAAHEAHKELAKEAKRVKDALEKVELRLWQTDEPKGILPPDDAFSQIQYARFAVASSWDAPTAAQTAYLEQAATTLAGALGDLNKLLTGEVAAFKRRLQETDLRLLPELPPIEVQED
ncbi:MAG TPA: hypothetical protein VF121_01410 [Thermoanaerobaculia bacterium]|nr:hypothetical protein [Thermoanaerobaculia bacterium]